MHNVRASCGVGYVRMGGVIMELFSGEKYVYTGNVDPSPNVGTS
jgi:hypothetical protein